MTIKRKEFKSVKLQIDLTGPEGNAFVLLGYVRTFGKELGFDDEKIKSIQSEMKKSDYENLIKVFDSHFGEYVDLLR